MSEENDTRPIWMVDLEKRLEAVKLVTRQLGHELGAGAKCFKCNNGCPGLELHYWRKKCLKCKCNKEDHNVPNESDLRFEILLCENKHQNSKNFNSTKQELHNMLTKIEPSKCDELKTVLKQTAQKGPVLFDWVPPNVSNELAAEYMVQLPVDKMPISRSSGAQQRVLQLGKQIPLHDIDPAVWHKLPAEAQEGFQKYLQDVRDNVVGQGRIQRIFQKEYVAESTDQNLQEPHQTGAVRPIEKKNNMPALPMNYGKFPGMAQHGNNVYLHDVKNHNVPIMWSPLNAKSRVPIVPSFKNPLRIGEVSMPSTKLGDKPSFEENGENLNAPGSTAALLPEKHSNTHDTSSVAPYEVNTQYGFDSHPTGYIAGTSSDPNNPELTRGYSLDRSESIRKYAEDVENANKQQYWGEEKPLYCAHCKEVILMNTVAIVTDRAGPSVKWHPKCFVCTVCNELLVDLMYFYYKEKVYCGRHYADIKKIPRCHACDELIFVDVYTMAEGKAYHVGHFCCTECDVELGGMKYLLHEDQNVCLPCFEAKYCKLCHSCGTVIKPDEQGINILDTHWHATPSCFVCNTCGKSLVGLRIVQRSGTLFCSRECVVEQAP